VTVAELVTEAVSVTVVELVIAEEPEVAVVNLAEVIEGVAEAVSAGVPATGAARSRESTAAAAPHGPPAHAAARAAGVEGAAAPEVEVVVVAEAAAGGADKLMFAQKALSTLGSERWRMQ